MLKWCHTLKKNQLILIIALDMCILLSDVATADHLQCIYHVCCVPTGTPTRSCTISDMLTWLQVFSILIAIVVSSENITREEAASLASHSYLI